MSILTAGMEAVKSAFAKAPTKVLTEKDRAKRLRLQKTMRRIESGEYQAEYRAAEAEGDAIRARVHAGELTVEALKRHGERVRPLILEREQFQQGGEQFLLDTCTDADLLAEGMVLRRRKTDLLKRMHIARQTLQAHEESLHISARGLKAHEARNAELRRNGRAVDTEGEATLRQRVALAEGFCSEAKADLADMQAELAKLEKAIADIKREQMLS